MSAFLIDHIHHANHTHLDIDTDSPYQRIRRSRLTPHQIDVLTDVFDNDAQPSMEERVSLASQLGMETKQVTSWFQNRRQKVKSQASSVRSHSHSPSPPTTTNPINAFEMPRQSTFQLPPPPSARTLYASRDITMTKEEPSESTLQPIFQHPSPPSSGGGHPHRTARSTRAARTATSPLPSHHNTSHHSHPQRTSHAGTSRARMSPSQRAYLQSIYDHNPTPSMELRAEIAQRVGISVAKVTNWFRNLRQSERKKRMTMSVMQEEGGARGGGDESDEEDESEHEAVTPWASPEAHYAHTFPAPPSPPTNTNITTGTATTAKMEDALLLLYFQVNCGLEEKCGSAGAGRVPGTKSLFV